MRGRLGLLLWGLCGWRRLLARRGRSRRRLGLLGAGLTGTRLLWLGLRLLGFLALLCLRLLGLVRLVAGRLVLLRGCGVAAPAAGPLSPIVASSAPTSTVSSSATLISSRVPATGDGISVSTLSVETSSNGSSTATSSPTCFSQRVTVPSVTLSPRAGRVTAVPDPPPDEP